MSQVIKEKLQGELDELETELRIHLPKEIKRARKLRVPRGARPPERRESAHRGIATEDQ
jgi:hypothetical protein